MDDPDFLVLSDMFPLGLAMHMDIGRRELEISYLVDLSMSFDPSLAALASRVV